MDGVIVNRSLSVAPFPPRKFVVTSDGRVVRVEPESDSPDVNGTGVLDEVTLPWCVSPKKKKKKKKRKRDKNPSENVTPDENRSLHDLEDVSAKRPTSGKKTRKNKNPSGPQLSVDAEEIVMKKKKLSASVSPEEDSLIGQLKAVEDISAEKPAVGRKKRKNEEVVESLSPVEAPEKVVRKKRKKEVNSPSTAQTPDLLGLSKPIDNPEEEKQVKEKVTIRNFVVANGMASGGKKKSSPAVVRKMKNKISPKVQQIETSPKIFQTEKNPVFEVRLGKFSVQKGSLDSLNSNKKRPLRRRAPQLTSPPKKPKLQSSFPDQFDVVWAKKVDHPWWPGLVATDPESGEHSRKDEDGTIKEVHVQFFGAAKMDSWVSNGPKSLMPFTGPKPPVLFLKHAELHKKNMEVAVKEAMEAHKLAKVERYLIFAKALEERSDEERVVLRLECNNNTSSETGSPEKIAGSVVLAVKIKDCVIEAVEEVGAGKKNTKLVGAKKTGGGVDEGQDDVALKSPSQPSGKVCLRWSVGPKTSGINKLRNKMKKQFPLVHLVSKAVKKNLTQDEGKKEPEKLGTPKEPPSSEDAVKLEKSKSFSASKNKKMILLKETTTRGQIRVRNAATGKYAAASSTGGSGEAPSKGTSESGNKRNTRSSSGKAGKKKLPDLQPLETKRCSACSVIGAPQFGTWGTFYGTLLCPMCSSLLEVEIAQWTKNSGSSPKMDPCPLGAGVAQLDSRCNLTRAAESRCDTCRLRCILEVVKDVPFNIFVGLAKRLPNNRIPVSVPSGTVTWTSDIYSVLKACDEVCFSEFPQHFSGLLAPVDPEGRSRASPDKEADLEGIEDVNNSEEEASLEDNNESTLDNEVLFTPTSHRGSSSSLVNNSSLGDEEASLDVENNSSFQSLSASLPSVADTQLGKADDDDLLELKNPVKNIQNPLRFIFNNKKLRKYLETLDQFAIRHCLTPIDNATVMKKQQGYSEKLLSVKGPVICPVCLHLLSVRGGGVRVRMFAGTLMCPVCVEFLVAETDSAMKETQNLENDSNVGKLIQYECKSGTNACQFPPDDNPRCRSCWLVHGVNAMKNIPCKFEAFRCILLRLPPDCHLLSLPEQVEWRLQDSNDHFAFFVKPKDGLDLCDDDSSLEQFGSAVWKAQKEGKGFLFKSDMREKPELCLKLSKRVQSKEVSTPSLSNCQLKKFGGEDCQICWKQGDGEAKVEATLRCKLCETCTAFAESFTIPGDDFGIVSCKGSKFSKGCKLSMNYKKGRCSACWLKRILEASSDVDLRTFLELSKKLPSSKIPKNLDAVNFKLDVFLDECIQVAENSLDSAKLEALKQSVEGFLAEKDVLSSGKELASSGLKKQDDVAVLSDDDEVEVLEVVTKAKPPPSPPKPSTSTAAVQVISNGSPALKDLLKGKYKVISLGPLQADGSARVLSVRQGVATLSQLAEDSERIVESGSGRVLSVQEVVGFDWANYDGEKEQEMLKMAPGNEEEKDVIAAFDDVIEFFKGEDFA